MLLRQNQAGFTLVELMIALLVSLILLTGVLNIMLSNRQSLRAQKALSGLQSRANLLNTVLDNSVAAAGYHVDPDTYLDDLFMAKTGDDYAGKLEPGAAISGKQDGNNDILRVRFESQGALHDCQGHQIGGESTPTEKKLSNFSIGLKNDDQLYCKIYRPTDKHSGRQALVNGVQRFKVFYGLVSAPGRSVKQHVERYVEKLDSEQQKHVVSLRVQALLRTKKRVLAQKTSRTFEFADNETITTDDRRGYLMLDRTVALRNNLQ